MPEEPSPVADITSSGSSSRAGGIRWFAVVLLLAYLALLVIGTVSLWRIAGGGPASWVAAAVFALIFILGWRMWLAAGSHRRLAFRERVTVHLVGGPIVVVLASPAQIWLPAVIALSIVIMCDALNERDRRPALDVSIPDLI